MKTFDKKSVWTSFMMSIFVLYIHANNLNNIDLSSKENLLDSVLTNILGNGLGSMAVPFFFMLSGYRFFSFSIVAPNRLYIIKQKLLRRIGSLVMPYLIWNCFGLIFYTIATRIDFISMNMNNPQAVELSFCNILKGIFLYNNYYTMWFLHDLIVLICLTPILMKVLQNKFASVVFGILILMIYIAAQENSVKFFEYYFFKIQSLLFFFTGSFLRVYCKKMFERKSTIRESTIALILLIVAVSIWLVEIPGLSKLALFTEPILFWVAADILPQPKLSWFYKQSFFIYAAHLVPITVTSKVLAMASRNNPWLAAAAYLITPWIVLGELYVLAKILCFFIPNIYNFLSGGRSRNRPEQ